MLAWRASQVRASYEYTKWGYRAFDPIRDERSCEVLLFALRRCMIRHTADAVLRLPPKTEELVPGARPNLARKPGFLDNRDVESLLGSSSRISSAACCTIRQAADSVLRLPPDRILGELMSGYF